MDPIDTPRLAPNHIEIATALELLQLARRQVSAQQSHTALVRWVQSQTAQEQAQKSFH
jgi:hypothetical protein